MTEEEQIRKIIEIAQMFKTARSDGQKEKKMAPTVTNRATRPNIDDGAYEMRDVQVAREGTRIVLPADPREMTEPEAVEILQRIINEQKQLVSIHEEVDCFPLEGAWGLRQVLQETFGYVLTASPGINPMTGEKIPAATMVSLETGVDQVEQVMWGRFNIPGVTGELKTGFSYKDNRPIFAITGKTTVKDQKTVKMIADKVRKYLAVNSLYRGKAIKIQTIQSEHNEDRYMVDFQNPPRFIDTNKVNEEELVYSADVASLIQTNVWTPIEKTEMCRAARIPLKRSVLLEGPFGTGKTLAAYVTAKKAQANGWTFIYMDRAQALRDVLIFARKYAPVVIFCEDIEQVVSSGRSTSVNDVLNNIDGIDSKGHEVLCIFTTNNVEKIEPAMLRAGRLDAVITVLPPDAKAAEKLVRVYSRDLVAPDEDLSVACKELDGQIPAFIREVVERAKLFAIGHLNRGDKLRLRSEDIRLAAVGMKRHFALVNRAKPKPLTAGDKMAIALTEIMGHNSDNDSFQAGPYASEEAAVENRRIIDQEQAALN